MGIGAAPDSLRGNRLCAGSSAVGSCRRSGPGWARGTPLLPFAKPPPHWGFLGGAHVALFGEEEFPGSLARSDIEVSSQQKAAASEARFNGVKGCER